MLLVVDLQRACAGGYSSHLGSHLVRQSIVLSTGPSVVLSIGRSVNRSFCQSVDLSTSDLSDRSVQTPSQQGLSTNILDAADARRNDI